MKFKVVFLGNEIIGLIKLRYCCFVYVMLNWNVGNG